MTRPGPKPKRLYLRLVRFSGEPPPIEGTRTPLRTLVNEFDRVGRLVAHGPLTDPPGDFVVFRATDREEALRLLRADPFREMTGENYLVLEWKVEEQGAGVSIEPPPARGSGRMTQVQRVAVIVRDQEAAIQWYRDVLGLEVLRNDPDTGYVEVSLGPEPWRFRSSRRGPNGAKPTTARPWLASARGRGSSSARTASRPSSCA